MTRRYAFPLAVSAIFLTEPLWAADPPGPDIQRRQAVQQEQTQRRQQTEADVLSNTSAPAFAGNVVVEETPCFTVNAIEWQAAETFAWLTEKTDGFIGQCLGVVSLKRLRDYLTLALLSRGYITSKVIFPQQNLASGTLRIELLPGRVGKVVDADSPIGHPWFPLATASGNVLNQRDLDQSLENYRRLPSQTEVRVDLIPGELLGESDLKLWHGKGDRVRGSVALDNSGSKSTGKNQLSSSMSVDSPLGMYDSLALNYNTNANARNQTLGSRATGVQWNVPFGYASLFVAANQSRYKQTVVGFNAPIAYTGRSTSYEAGIGFVPYRSGSAKGQSYTKLFRKTSRNYIDDAEISVQARDLLGAELSHTHKHFLGNWSLTAGGTLRISLPGRSRNVGVIVGEPEWDGRYRVGILNLAAARAFTMLGQRWRYQTQLRWQYTRTALPPAEYASIGGRYSVRGFDGEQTLSAEAGGYWRNELGMGLPAIPHLSGNHETYIALDAGRIAGDQSQGLPHKSLVGAAVGVRGSIDLTRRMSASYDLNAGTPISKPDTLATARPALAAFISFDFSI